MKLYQLSGVALLALTTLAGCGNGDAPVEVSVSYQQETHFLSGEPMEVPIVVITATADEVEVSRTIMNRGNSCGIKSWIGRGNLKYGQSLKGRLSCEPDAVKEVKVETNQGDYTFNF